jgi:hypothetical protein
VADLDIEGNLRTYLGDRTETARYASFDYCFNHFQSHREEGRLGALVEGAGLELTCLHLGFYLASWGMLRGSSELLQRSVKTFVPVVNAIVSAPAQMWDIDADQYSEANVTAILDFAHTLRGVLPAGSSDILVTKVMLGTMGCVPAFDTNFKKGFGVWTFGRKSLRKVGEFYRDHAEVIENHRKPTLDFDTGLPTDRCYTRAKVIDMVFFIEGA